MRRKRVLSATMMILGIWLLAGLCAAASDSEEEPGYMENIEESLMEEFDFQEIEEVLDELFPEEKLSFRRDSTYLYEWRHTGRIGYGETPDKRSVYLCFSGK